MTTKQRKKKVKEANKAADKAIRDAQLPEALKSLKDFVYTPLTVSYGQFILACLLIIGILAMSSKSEAACTYRPDALGNVRYSCDAGVSGTYRTDVLGTTRDSRTGTTYRTDVLGNTRSSNGTTWRTDSLGTVRGSDGTTWRKDSLGTWRSNNGNTCRTDSLGTMRCN